MLNTKKFKDEYVDRIGLDRNEFEAKKAEIAQSYEDNRNASCERGTAIHAEFENAFYDGDKKVIKSFGLGGDLPVFKGNYQLDLQRGIYPEYLLSYRIGDFLMCGQIDLLSVFDNQIVIGDHKTNKEIKRKSFYNKQTKTSVKMKYPLNNLDDCDYWHYALQLSTYAWMIQQRNPKYEVHRLFLH